MSSIPENVSPILQDKILEHLFKILSSQSFQGSERSRKLLRFLVEQTVNGQPDRLKEYTLGTEALGKSTSFDPRTDPIVRAEASRLRNRLDKYYATEGQTDSLVIALSKGSYVPRFRSRMPAPSSAPGVDTGWSSRSKNINWFALGLVVVACTVTIIFWGVWRVQQPDRVVSIAVLPFANLSTDPRQEFFSDGITDEIAGALAKVADLRIVARSSAYTFKNQNKQASVIGQALGATHLIEGSVRQDGNRVRITAQLIEADNGLQLWSESYDRDLTDVFAIQEDIATAIAGALRMPLGLRKGQRLVANRTIDAESYQQYLRAKPLVRARRPGVPEAIKILEPLVIKNPDFAPAWVQLAHAYSLMPNYNRLGSVDEVRRVIDSFRPKAEAAARRAIQLDPDLPDGYWTLGRVQAGRGKWLLAEDLYSKALALDPNNPGALQQYSNLLAIVGRLREALAMKRQLRALEPYDPGFNQDTAEIAWLNGQNDAAIGMLRNLPSEEYGGLDRAMIYASMGRYTDAADTLDDLRARLAPPPDIRVAKDTASLMHTAANILRTAPAHAASPQSLPRFGFLVNFVYLYVGAADRTLEYYEDSVDAGSFSPGGGDIAFLWHASYAPVRKTERFKAFMRKAGLVDYWRARGWTELCHPVADDFTCD